MNYCSAHGCGESSNVGSLDGVDSLTCQGAPAAQTSEVALQSFGPVGDLYLTGRQERSAATRRSVGVRVVRAAGSIGRSGDPMVTARAALGVASARRNGCERHNPMAPRPHWLFGDQLGPHFVNPRGGGPGAHAPLVMIEARSVLRRRRFHRAKAHLVLSAMRHRAAELGDRVTYVRAETYAEGLERALGHPPAPLTVCHPTSRRALDFARTRKEVEVLPAKGFMVSQDDFARWADSRQGLRLESFYRWVRTRHDLLMDGGEPAGGRWNLDHDNREPPPRGQETLEVRGPWQPREDAIDDEVRHDLDRWERDGDVSFVGRDGPRRFPATRREALSALRHFITHRLPDFGCYEDAMLAGTRC